MQELIVTILLAVLTGAAGILLAVGSRPGSGMTKRQRRMLGRILGASLLRLVLQLIPESAFDAWDSLVPGVQSGIYDAVIAGQSMTADRMETFAATSHVKFAELNDEEIDYYVDNYLPFDKAGAYGIQEWIGMVAVEELRGSYFNVMGLPVQRLYTALKNF